MDESKGEEIWTDISYRGFYDVPRSILARLGDCWFFFNSRFDDDLDEYIDRYEVWRMPFMKEEQQKGSWLLFPGIALERMKDVSLDLLPFQVPRRSG